MAQKKTLNRPVAERRDWVEPSSGFSIRRQCRLFGLSRSRYYYTPAPESQENLRLMRLIDLQYMRHPEFGSPRMTDWLCEEVGAVNHKRVASLMRRMGLQAITPGPHTSRPAPGHKIYPYLLRDVKIDRVNQVWSADITYIPMATGFLYLTAVMDWHSRYILSWELSNSLGCEFCVSALREALRVATPECFNTDQGSQFTSAEFTGVLLGKEIPISMDGRGRALDNVFIERLWWTLKYEEVYPKDYATGRDLHRGLTRYFKYYNEERRHSALDKNTPAAIFSAGMG